MFKNNNDNNDNNDNSNNKNNNCKKDKKTKFTVIILAVLCVLTLKIITMMAATASAAAPSIPSIFHNDSKDPFQLHNKFPLEIIYGIPYVPIELFECLNNIDIRTENNFREDFYIMYKKLNYISFKVSSAIAETNKSGISDTISCKVEFRNNTTYVPAHLTAESLGLICEYKPEYNTIRIKEVAATKSFDELLARYIPKSAAIAPPVTTPEPITLPPVPTPPPPIPTTARPDYNNDNTTQPTTTEEETTTEPTTPENTQEILNYIMVYDGFSDIPEINDVTETYEVNEAKETENSEKSKKINSVLENLQKNKIRALFFMSVGEILENPDMLRKIISSGNDIGVRVEIGNPEYSADNLISELETANKLIYTAVKQKTRFCMFGDNSDNSDNYENYDNFENYEFYGNELKKQGYYLCKANLDLSDISDYFKSYEYADAEINAEYKNNIFGVDDMIDLLKQKTVNLISVDISDGENYMDMLNMAEQAGEVKFYINISYINNANILKILEHK